MNKINTLMNFLLKNSFIKEFNYLKKISSDDSSIQNFLESSLNFGFCNNDANKQLFHSTFSEYNSLTLKTLEHVYCDDFLNAMLSFLDAVNQNLSFDLFSIINSKFKSYKTYKAASLFQFDLEKVYATYSDFKELILESLKESIESEELTEEQVVEFIDSIKKEKNSLNFLNLKIEEKIKDISQGETEVKKIAEIKEWFDRKRIFDKEIEELSSSVIFYVRSHPNVKFVKGEGLYSRYNKDEWKSDFPEDYKNPAPRSLSYDYDHDVPEDIKEFIDKEYKSNRDRITALQKYKAKARQLRYKEFEDGDKDKLSSEKAKWVIENKEEIIDLIKKGIKVAIYNNDYIDNAISIIRGLFAKNYKTYKYYGSEIFKNFKEKEIKMIEKAVEMSDEEIKDVILNAIKEIIISPDFKIIMYDSPHKTNKAQDAAYNQYDKELRVSYETAYIAKDNPEVFLEIISHEMLHRIDIGFADTSYAKSFAISKDLINIEGKYDVKDIASISKKMFGDDKLSERFNISDHKGHKEYPNIPEELFSIMGNLRRFFDLNNIEINKKNIKYILENKAESLPVDFKHHYLGMYMPGSRGLFDEKDKEKNLFINLPIDKKVDFIFKALTTDYQTFSEDEIFGDVISFDKAMALSEDEKEEKKKEVGQELKSRILKFREER